MHFFGKDVDIIKRILNLVLVLWFVGALFVILNSTINFLIREPKITYDEYKANGCSYYDGAYTSKMLGYPIDDLTDEEQEKYCIAGYKGYEYNYNNNFESIKNILYSLGNAVIVGGFIFIINKKK